MVLWLTDPQASQPELTGGKASRLSAAVAAGFPVPAGFVVTAGEELDEAELTAVAAGLAPRVAVRSSAVAEDLADASFAGLYETYLNIPPDQVLSAVRRCRAAADTDRVRAYRSAPAGHQVAVLVQAMVPADSAGVAFSADPVTGSAAAVVVTAVPGLADQLVAGTVSGEQWRVTGGSAAPTRTDPAAGPVGGVLTAGQAVDVAAMVRRLEVLFEGPQDWNGPSLTVGCSCCRSGR